ncbi:MAG TPA: hypothetical protein VGW40_09215 [Allosphingosinicella sp.]|nr:hypothetical protein [Allosphingosinicella sp.]
MKRIYMSLAAVSALAVAAPLAAQPWQGERSTSGQLQARFDAGVESGAISRMEARPLRAQLRQFMQLERQYSRAGFNPWERRALRERSRTLNLDITAAVRSGQGRYDREDRYSADFDADGRGSHRGDRFAGDVRVGQHFSGRQVALPIQYRDRYRDSDAAYYRYDDKRVYQIDRNTGLILAMFDIAG